MKMDKIGPSFFFLIVLGFYISCVPAVEEVMGDERQQTGVATLGKCHFEGKNYSPGDRVWLPQYCHKMMCRKGRWIIITPLRQRAGCGRCQIYNDPHITTGDNKAFSFHKKCRFAALTRVNLPIIPPNFIGPNDAQTDRGVFPTFKNCPGSITTTCLSKTEVKFNKDVFIEFEHTTPVKFKIIEGIGHHGLGVQPLVAGNTGDASKFDEKAWIFSDSLFTPAPNSIVFCFKVKYTPKNRATVTCILCITKKFSVLICPGCLVIWYRKMVNEVRGLCGNFDGKMANDCTTPDEQVLAHVPFGLSWKTKVNEAGCDQRFKLDSLMETYVKVNKENCKGIDGYTKECQLAVDGHADKTDSTNKAVLVDACVEDVCAAERHSRNDLELKEGINRWVENIKDNAFIFNENLEQE